MQKLIYTAGPFSAPTEWGQRCNIRIAECWALAIWKAGHVALCPHANSANFSGELDADAFIKGDLEMLSRCDGVLMLPGWEKSRGAQIEMKVAEVMEIPVFFWNKVEELKAYLDGELD